MEVSIYSDLEDRLDDKFGHDFIFRKHPVLIKADISKKGRSCGSFQTYLCYPTCYALNSQDLFDTTEFFFNKLIGIWQREKRIDTQGIDTRKVYGVMLSKDYAKETTNKKIILLPDLDSDKNEERIRTIHATALFLFLPNQFAHDLHNVIYNSLMNDDGRVQAHKYFFLRNPLPVGDKQYSFDENDLLYVKKWLTAFKDKTNTNVEFTDITNVYLKEYFS